MPKYYIKCGDIKFIIDSSDEKSAILAMINRYKGKGYILPPKICINQRGFKHIGTKDCYDTDKFLRKN
jgi:hypothetical protein